MISRLSGTILEKQLPLLIVDVGGIGYEVHTPFSTGVKAGEIGSTVSLFIVPIYREDAQLLFGFASQEERSMFKALLKVNGVGPKLALAILSSMELSALEEAIATEALTVLIKVPGVGRKTATRILLELKGHLPSSNESKGVLVDARLALEALGYKAAEAERALRKVDMEHNHSVESLIRAALKRMAVE